MVHYRNVTSVVATVRELKFWFWCSYLFVTFLSFTFFIIFWQVTNTKAMCRNFLTLKLKLQPAQSQAPSHIRSRPKIIAFISISLLTMVFRVNLLHSTRSSLLHCFPYSVIIIVHLDLIVTLYSWMDVKKMKLFQITHVYHTTHLLVSTYLPLRLEF